MNVSLGITEGVFHFPQTIKVLKLDKKEIDV